ncbi:MAG: RelA/SpoT family protein [Gammaproteobacteria bacterium]|nr:RelA/SpoT family protein [Gammaproteobacteria bacterium]
MKYFKKLRKELDKYLAQDSVGRIAHAYEFAAHAHADQTRHTGEAYIVHPVAVAMILAKMRLDQQTIIAALLHDVLEDTLVQKEQLVRLFGDEVADLVDGLSKLTSIEFETRAQAQAENFQKMIMAMAKDIRVILVKLADRLHNMRTLEAVPEEKRHRIVRETLEIYAPIANRLGINEIRVAYEELGFEALYPNRYRVLQKTVKKVTGNRSGILSDIEKSLNDRLLECQLPPAKISSRQKHVYSIYKKMREKQLSFSEVMDIYGFRIVVESVDMCYRVLGAFHTLYKPMHQRFKDYIAIPKSNGYQSLHTTLFTSYGVPLEIQIRTEAMDQLAEHGIAAHWLYKSGEKISDHVYLHTRAWISTMLELQKNSDSSLDFIETVKTDLFPHDVYVFTPQGEILELPEGATAVDFAYAIHSDIGHRCVGVKIDKQLMPLSTILKSGQTVEIIRAPSAHPSATWYDFVVTGKAKSSIRHYLKVNATNLRDKKEEPLSINVVLKLKALVYWRM